MEGIIEKGDETKVNLQSDSDYYGEDSESESSSDSEYFD